MADNETDNVMVSISAVSAVQDTVNHHDNTTNSNDSNGNNIDNLTNNSSKSKNKPTIEITTIPLVPTLSITSETSSESSDSPSIFSTTTTTTTATTSTELTTSSSTVSQKVPSILLPPVEIESDPIDSKKSASLDGNDNNKENVDPLENSSDSPKQGVAKPKISAAATTATKTSTGVTKKPLASSLGKATTATSAVKKLTTSSLTKASLGTGTATKSRPPIPTSLRGTTSSPTATTTKPATATATRLSTATKSATKPAAAPKPRSACDRALAPPPVIPPPVRKSPSTPALRTTGAAVSPARNSTVTGRRVASSSGAETGSPRSSPSATPGPTRSPSQASIASAASTVRRPLTTTSRVTTAATTTTTKPSTSSTLAARKTPVTSKTPSPSSTLTASKTVTRPTAAQAVGSGRSTPVASTTRSTLTSTKPLSDAAKVKMLNTLQEKHDQTLKLMQEQEERMKREIEELTLLQEPQRKPIPSDVQEVLKEMEDLRKQFNEAKSQHEKTLEDLAAQHTLEVTQLKEAQEALLSTMTIERDTIAESLKASDYQTINLYVLQESGELTERERDTKIKELEEQIKATAQSHDEASESLRAEIESEWTARHENKLQELTNEHGAQLQAIEDKALASGNSKDGEIQELKDSFDQQIKHLESEHETRVAELVAKHELDVQELKDKMASLSNTNEESVTQMNLEHTEALEKLKAELQAVQEAKAELESELQTVQEAKIELESELERVRSENKDEMDRIRAELDDALKQLASQSTEAVELQKQVDELTADLENASMSTMLKNTKRYKVKNVQVYGSSVSGNLKVKRAQLSINDALEQLGIEYEFVDLAVDEEAKRYIRGKNGGETELPQIFSGGEYRGVFDDFEYAVETNQLAQFLAFDRVKGFVPRHKVDFNKSSQYASNAQDGDAEQGAGSPSAVMNGMGNRSIAPTNGSRNGDIGTSMYLISPGSTRFHSTASLVSNGSRRRSSLKPGFVQAASQAWDGVLKDDITHAKHDLGITNPVIPDDDELDELYEQGAITEAELQAMLEGA
ncbi:hypothetical protein BGZ46_008127 [Entomortierella lignicola]|nr:hypothetical protein BGZ46_008127 [Entomortierella lignicola]